MSGVSMPHCRNREYHHSWSPSSILFIVDGSTVRHASVLVPRLSPWVSNAGASAMTSYNTVCASCTCWRQSSPFPSWRSMVWSPVLNSVFTWRAATRFPVTDNEYFQFYQADRVGFGISSPACLNGRRVIPRIMTSVVDPLKRDWRKNVSRAASPYQNAYPMCGVTRRKS